jgi:protein-L-isoaspartate(D-aspartate) O-methyltransferase
MDLSSRAKRRHLIRSILWTGGTRDPRILAAMERVPRHLFVPFEYRPLAYENRPLPIGHDQTISQPQIIAMMLDALALKGYERVLEVGTGSGYQAALLGHLAREVYTIEIAPDLAESAKGLLRELGYANVHVIRGDGGAGWPPAAPYDAIIVAAAAPSVPSALLEQLAEGGRLVLPLGEPFQQSLFLIEKDEGDLSTFDLGPCAFVPLVGETVRARPQIDSAEGRGGVFGI